MRVLVQRVSRARVLVEGAVAGEIGAGLLAFVGFAPADTDALVQQLAAKLVGLRIFEDNAGRMNRSLEEAGGAVLCVSQFTLYGDMRRGRRPSFAGAAEPRLADELYGEFCGAIEALGIHCERGVFGAHMMVELVNDGPVTLMLDSADLERPRRA
jgi:D-tyrosyl-tRNA(Tyr) deacylase